MKHLNLIRKNGFTLIESLIGIAILVIVFTGIYGAFALALQISSRNKAAATALTLANHRIEMIRNLSYNDVGVIAGIPSGTLTASEALNRNGINFTVDISVVYIDDVFDALTPVDTLNVDYKRARVKVSWPGIWGDEVVLITDVAPNGVETTNGGGTLKVQVFDADGAPLPNTSIHLENNNVVPNISTNYATNEFGMLLIPGAPTSTESYQITASKAGYSTDRTYGTGEVANPLKAHSTVVEGGLTEVSFAIDQTSYVTLRTLSPGTLANFSDDFDDLSLVATSTNLVASTTLESLILDYETGDEYFLSGMFQTNTITPALLDEWTQFAWVDTEPAGTDIKYQIMYYDGANWSPVPDGDLAANSIGFDDSPVNLSNLSATTYDEIRVQGNFITVSTSTSPYISSLIVNWQTTEPSLIANVPFHIQSSKTIGTDVAFLPVYKLSQNLQTGAGGDRDFPELEWDTYTISVDGAATGYDIAASSPAQPVTVLPASNQTIDLTLVPHAANTLLVYAKTGTGVPITGAEVRLYNIGLGYDETVATGTTGQSFFTPLGAATYNLEVVKDGYTSYIDTVAVLGQTSIGLVMSP